MKNYEFETVWSQPREAISSEAIRFWTLEQAMPEGVAIERATQLVVVCRSKTQEDEIAAVSTAMPHFVEQLGLTMFYFRAFVGRKHRATGLRGSKIIQKLIRESFDVLSAAQKHAPEKSPLGLYFEIQNTSIRRNRRDLVWRNLGANIVYIGRLPQGGHARVWYFDEAKM